MTDWGSITQEVADGMAEVGFEAKLLRPTGNGGTPHNPVPNGSTGYDVLVLDFGTKEIYAGGSLQRIAHTLMIGATGEAPKVDDRIRLSDGEYDIKAVMPFQPGGVPLYFDCEITR